MDAPERRFLRELVIESIEHEPNPNDEDDEYAYEPGDDVPSLAKDRIQFVSIYPLPGVKEFSCLHTLQVGCVGEEDDVWTATSPSSWYTSTDCYCHPTFCVVETAC